MAAVPLKGPHRTGTYLQKMDMRIGLFRRNYLVHIPEGYDGLQELPLVLVVHGAFGTGRGMEKESGFSRLGDKAHLIVVYPQGMGLFDWLRHWNSGHCCGRARKKGVDDVAFLKAVIEEVWTRFGVDRTRVYMVGHSNGGMMTHRFAAQHPEMIAAAAVVSGTIGGKPSYQEPEWRIPVPVHPVPMMVVHGKADKNVSYAGGPHPRYENGLTMLSVSESVRFWIQSNGANPEPQVALLRQERIVRERWTGARNESEVVLYSIEGWGHDWPGLYFTSELVGDPLQGFDVAAVIWSFFEKHQRTFPYTDKQN